jgi:hypothetical protein
MISRNIVKQIALIESCPKNGDVPNSPLGRNGSLMPSVARKPAEARAGDLGCGVGYYK